MIALLFIALLGNFEIEADGLVLGTCTGMVYDHTIQKHTLTGCTPPLTIFNNGFE